ncbi:hypothetical protein POTOM_041432 [Populus tomentosa]|uniref:Alpha N-terminal protein methyltransferase 1 n=1 Tax=Populus tomentosa TaxID=118781 RepID=A0A8X8CID7_POPTO|nr:hypothetical protein POTOM_041432 [Populus tomentosa]
MEAAGTDSDGREFKNPDEMWLEHTGDTNKKTQWYRDGVAYWEVSLFVSLFVFFELPIEKDERLMRGVEASVNGVLGGYGHVNDADVKGSEGFLQTLLAELFVDGGIDRHLVALDCGSGIGRITKNLLIRYFNEVDLLEPVSHFLDAARESLVQENHMALDKHKATNFYCVPLQEFTPDAGRYDVIWVQWCIGHLTDDDFVSFFNRAKIGLKPGGFFVLKENLARSGFVLDKEDRSITRSDSYFKGLFRTLRAVFAFASAVSLIKQSICIPAPQMKFLVVSLDIRGLMIRNCTGNAQCRTAIWQPIFGPDSMGQHIFLEQKGLPKELFAVKMYALTTDIPKRVIKARSKVQANRPGIIK